MLKISQRRIKCIVINLLIIIWFTFHLIKTIIDDDIKCLCGKSFKKSEVTIIKNSPTNKDRGIIECSKCGNNLRKFWGSNVKIFKKVTNRLYSVNGTDNLVEIKKNET